LPSIFIVPPEADNTSPKQENIITDVEYPKQIEQIKRPEIHREFNKSKSTVVEDRKLSPQLEEQGGEIIKDKLNLIPEEDKFIETPRLKDPVSIKRKDSDFTDKVVDIPMERQIYDKLNVPAMDVNLRPIKRAKSSSEVFSRKNRLIELAKTFKK